MPPILNFLAYFSLTLVLWAVALFVYVKVTPYNEFALIRQGNLAASLGLTGAAVGLAAPLASLAAHAVTLTDLATWAGVALVVQLCTWVFLSTTVLGGRAQLKAAIENDQRAKGLFLGGASACVGLLNAACLTY